MKYCKVPENGFCFVIPEKEEKSVYEYAKEQAQYEKKKIDPNFFLYKEISVEEYDYNANVVYTSEAGVDYNFGEILEIAKENYKFAKILLELATWQHIETIVDEFINSGEVLEYNGKYYLTGGQENLVNVDGEAFFYEVVMDKLRKNFEGYNEKVCGYFKDNKKVWIAYAINIVEGKKIEIRGFKKWKHLDKYIEEVFWNS